MVQTSWEILMKSNDNFLYTIFTQGQKVKYTNPESKLQQNRNRNGG